MDNDYQPFKGCTALVGLLGLLAVLWIVIAVLVSWIT